MRPAMWLLQSDDSAVVGGIMALFGGAWCFLWLVVAGAMIAGMWKMFQKAGKDGWLSLIPIVNIVVMGQIVGWDGVKILCLFIPLINIVFGILLAVDLAKSFGKETLYALGLLLLPFVFYPILGFGSARYQGPAGAPTLGGPS